MKVLKFEQKNEKDFLISFNEGKNNEKLNELSFLAKRSEMTMMKILLTVN